ncbi:MAG: hypothetical protein H0X38_17655 [Planctomycetes bacterium]|nr:hypothetical protein [Planctomycetota bacterium]
MTASPRRHLGNLISFGDRSSVFLCADRLEIDQFEGYDVETKRVFFNDVLLITRHNHYSRMGLWLTGISTAIGMLIWLFSLTSTSSVSWAAFFIGFLPNLPFLALFLIPYVRVTVFGKRTKAAMSWHFRHARAAAVYAELVALVEQAQARERAELAGRVAPAVVVPLPTPADLTPPAATVPAPAFEELGDPGPSAPPA